MESRSWPLYLHPLELPPQKLAGVPRRFGVGVLMILVTAVAVLFAVLRWLFADLANDPHTNRDLYPAVFTIVSVLFIGVAAAQVLLFQGTRPRAASLWAGGILFPLEMLVLMAYQAYWLATWRYHPSSGFVATLFFCVPAGILFGYLAGTLTAGIFLVLWRFQKDPDEPPNPTVDLRPFTPDDGGMVAQWVQMFPPPMLWVEGTLPSLLERQHVERHLAATVGENPVMRGFVATCVETQRPVGYVELGNIDGEARSARIAVALIAPGAPQRGLLTMALIRAILKEAFDAMKLHRIEVRLPGISRMGMDCYLRARFKVEGVLEQGVLYNEGLYPLWQMSMYEDEWTRG